MKFIAALLVVVMALGFITCAYASNPGEKLGRGAANALSGALEVPICIGEEWKASNNAVIGMSVGLFKGIFWGIARTASGLYDLVTFPFPVPKNYDSIIKPDYVWRTEGDRFRVDKPPVK
ncbi:MAG: exosortase system-associated protein, TIGR04073 family [Candidatus Omnitrophica bacterium]|nr:exosortase system-associated protein, TIGR04073 family [Candidatus Omnitrophota bacterium]